tara:strand:- start:1161 stop:1580 length:420 start_codon:yes stop_codon:yes gene_type:complete
MFNNLLKLIIFANFLVKVFANDNKNEDNVGINFLIIILIGLLSFTLIILIVFIARSNCNVLCCNRFNCQIFKKEDEIKSDNMITYSGDNIPTVIASIDNNNSENLPVVELNNDNVNIEIPAGNPIRNITEQNVTPITAP